MELQTGERWGKNDADSFLYTLRKNTYDDKILIFNISSGIEKSKKDANIEDLNFFVELKNREFEYISMDGNHRSQAMWNHKDEMSEYKHKNVEVIIISHLSKEEIHNYTIRKNFQKAWNHSEIRNAQISKVNDLTRGISKDHILTTNSIKIKSNRRQNQEFFNSVLLVLDNMYQNKKRNIRSKELNNMIKNGVDEQLFKNFETISLVWAKLVDVCVSKSDKKIPKMFWTTLFTFSNHMLINNKMIINDKKYINHVADQFINIVNDIKSDPSLYGPGGIFDSSQRATFDNVDERLEYFITKIY